MKLWKANRTGDTVTLILDERSFCPQISDLIQNAIINPDGAIAQRGISFDSTTNPANNDDTYLFDRWILLSGNGNNNVNDVVDVFQSDDAPKGSKHSMRFQVETANNKFGHFQIFTNKNSIPFMNKEVSVSFQAKTKSGNAISNIRCAVLSWDGAANQPATDVVKTADGGWQAAGTNPVWATNWTAENIASNLALTINWKKFKIENINIDTSGMTNLAVFIWIDDDDCEVDDELFVNQILLHKGSFALPFHPRQVEEELILCLPYCWQLNSNDTDMEKVVGVGQIISTYEALILVRHPIKMRKIPTMINSLADIILTKADGSYSIDITITDKGTNFSSEFSCLLLADSMVGIGLVAGNATILMLNGDAAGDQWIRFDSEL